jgi:hypothetical protein
MKTYGYSVQFNYRVHDRLVHDAAVHYVPACTQMEAFMIVVRKVRNLLAAAGHADVNVSLVEQLDMGV